MIQTGIAYSRHSCFGASWVVELSDGTKRSLGPWPHSRLYLGRDENRRVTVKVTNEKEANFVSFVNP